jgi:hypothetical protein
MSWRLRVFALLVGTAIGGATSFQAAPQTCNAQSSRDHAAWVAEVMTRMRTIEPGMTREALLKVFTTEGGWSTSLRRKFVSRDCMYFKVDVEFRAVGRPARDSEGRVTSEEDGRDIILTISRPYLELPVND